MPSESVPRLNTYHFYENKWDSYEELYEWFEWEIPPSFNMADYACDRWAEDPKRPAIFAEAKNGDETIITFRQLRDYTNQIANVFTDHDISSGDRIAINLPQKPDAIAATIAAWKVGAVAVPLSPLFGPEALHHRITDSRATALVIDRTNTGSFRSIENNPESLDSVFVVDDVAVANDEIPLNETVPEYSREFSTVTTDPEDGAFIMYTSGTTGPPKGVLHAHRVFFGGLVLFILNFNNLKLREDAVYYTPSEWTWINSIVSVIFPALYYGKPVVGYEGTKFDPDTLFELLEKYEITSTIIPTTAVRKMRSTISNPDTRYQADSLNVIMTGTTNEGELEWLSRVFDDPVFTQGYGQTEAPATLVQCPAIMEPRIGKMGKPAPGHRVTVLDPERGEQIDEPNEIGELAVQCEGDPVILKEYWGLPEKTASKIQDGWLLSEDLVTRDADGYFEFKSRKDDVINCAGHRIGPSEIESILSDCDAVIDAGVIGVPDELRGEIPKAFVVLRDGIAPSDERIESLQTVVKERLAMYAYPREIEFIEELPRTRTDKAKRNELREREGI